MILSYNDVSGIRNLTAILVNDDTRVVDDLLFNICAGRCVSDVTEFVTTRVRNAIEALNHIRYSQATIKVLASSENADFVETLSDAYEYYSELSQVSILVSDHEKLRYTDRMIIEFDYEGYHYWCNLNVRQALDRLPPEMAGSSTPSKVIGFNLKNTGSFRCMAVYRCRNDQ